MNSATTSPARFALVKPSASDKHHRAVAHFTVQANGQVRVYGYATWTDHINDQIVSREEARKAWTDLLAQGYARSLEVEADLATIARERAERALEAA